MAERLTVPVLIALGAFLILWYLLGNELMRRRGRHLAGWCKQVADRFGASQTIKWYTLHSFKLEVQNPSRPLESLSLTGLTESWDVPIIWLWNRLHWRRDMVQAQLALSRQPLFGLELYRPGALLAGDARHAARQEGWDLAALDELRIAPASGRETAERLLAALGKQRQHLVRLSLRRNGTHLSLSLNVPEPEALPPQDFAELLRALAAAGTSQTGR